MLMHIVRRVVSLALVGFLAAACHSDPPLTPVAPPVLDDPINQLDLTYLRSSAENVMGQLVQALPAGEQSLVARIPLEVASEPGFVNAYASCEHDEPKMAVSDELLRIQAQLARARATDEIFGTTLFESYLRFLTDAVKPEQPVPQPVTGFFDSTQDTEARKVKRQHQLFEEELAFVMGHELAHHYLGHTGCVGSPHPLIQIGAVLSGRFPIFNQPFELAADTQGTTNLLNAGARQAGYPWTEGGGMMMLSFFAALEKITASDSILFAFVMSHPPSGVRVPIITRTADAWRAAQPRPPMPAP